MASPDKRHNGFEQFQTRLQIVEDQLAIAQLFHEYAHYLDTGQFDRYAALFGDDGEVKLGPLGRAVGQAAIAELMSAKLGDQVGQSYHLISNPIIKLAGDTAIAEVMWTVIARGENDKPTLALLGRHRDKLIRDGGRWRFQERAGYVDIPSAMPTGTHQ